MDKYESLKLENQLCFPLYATSKEVIKRYKPLLDKLDLTYTQYITMMVLWENKTMSVKDLGEKLFLDSGTLTPLLKNLESKGLILRERATYDERVLTITLTEKGILLKDKALSVPKKISSCINLSLNESLQLYNLLYKILDDKKRVN